MNLEVSIWTAYLFLEISGNTLLALAGIALLYGVIRLVVDEVSLNCYRGR